MTKFPIPLCVPRWEERDALSAGAQYSPSVGFHATENTYLPSLEVWLPWRWRYPNRPALLPDMLPASTWEENLRTALPADKWNALRKHCYAAAGHRCRICGASGKVEAHELWEFDDVFGIQKLIGLVCLCPICHKAKHYGFARRLGLISEVTEKIKEVNGWDTRMLDAALVKLQARTDERSKYHWELDLSWLTDGPYSLIYALDSK